MSKALPGLYKTEPPRPDGEFDLRLLRWSELKACIGHVFETDKPGANCALGEWYCRNEDCVVREVQISQKLHGEKMPKVIKCPACSSEMEFHRWLDVETLYHVDHLPEWMRETKDQNHD